MVYCICMRVRARLLFSNRPPLLEQDRLSRTAPFASEQTEGTESFSYSTATKANPILRVDCNSATKKSFDVADGPLHQTIETPRVQYYRSVDEPYI